MANHKSWATFKEWSHIHNYVRTLIAPLHDLFDYTTTFDHTVPSIVVNRNSRTIERESSANLNGITIYIRRAHAVISHLNNINQSRRNKHRVTAPRNVYFSLKQVLIRKWAKTQNGRMTVIHPILLVPSNTYSIADYHYA